MRNVFTKEFAVPSLQLRYNNKFIGNIEQFAPIGSELPCVPCMHKLVLSCTTLHADVYFMFRYRL